MRVQQINRGGVASIICADEGETLTVLREFAPWFLGFCRWEVRRWTQGDPTDIQQGPVEVLGSGSWRWRGRHAQMVDSLIERTAWFDMDKPEGQRLMRHPPKGDDDLPGHVYHQEFQRLPDRMPPTEDEE